MIFFKTYKGQVTLNFLFSFFAAVVIFAAMMKILHWRGADIAIMVGLMSETTVFSIMAFLVPPPEEPHWQRYFPNINEHPDVERARTGKFEVTPLTLPGASGNPALKRHKSRTIAGGKANAAQRRSEIACREGMQSFRITWWSCTHREGRQEFRDTERDLSSGCGRIGTS